MFIEQDERGLFYELTDGINKMAKDLGSMEQLRQDFISNISHEFQSPLTSISGYASLLRKDGATLKQLEYATIIEEESKRLSKLSENLLRLSALEAEDTLLPKPRSSWTDSLKTLCCSWSRNERLKTFPKPRCPK